MQAPTLQAPTLFKKKEEEKELTVYPITVLGAAKSGKTALVCSYVQNFCPTVYVPSTEPALFYKTVDIVEVKCPICQAESLIEEPFGDDSKRNRCWMLEHDKRCRAFGHNVLDGQTVFRCKDDNCGNEFFTCLECYPVLREKQSRPILVEIEDTFAWPRGLTADGEEHEIRTFINPSADPKEEDEHFVKMSERCNNNANNENKEKKGGGFFGIGNKAADDGKVPACLGNFEAPRHDIYSALTLGRLGFLIVFDCSDAASWPVAQQIHKALESHRSENKVEQEPVTFLVASQLDKYASSEECIKIREEAKQYVSDFRASRPADKSCNLFYHEVSATNFKAVKKMFRKMLLNIREFHDAHVARKGEAAAKGGGGLASLFGGATALASPKNKEAENGGETAEAKQKSCHQQ